jgi:2-oxo-4-hydroxy-4-carboxy-5-ureidoimidazoline decarboxylase
MAEPHVLLDRVSDDEARVLLTRCCGAKRWVDELLARRPFGSAESLQASSRAAFAALTPEDLHEAFSHHPRIGVDASELHARFADTARWSSAEQSGVADAGAHVLQALRENNLAYEARFGFPFIVCATGKSAAEMLAMLRQRLLHEPSAELAVAARELAKIAALRLEKLA